MMKEKIKLIAIDLDDTLLTDDNRISDRNCRAIQQAAAQGVHIVLATGRMYQTAAPIGKCLDLGDSPMILYSGGLIQRTLSGEVMYEKTISVPALQTLMELSRRNNWYIQVYIDDELIIHHETEQSRWYCEITGATPHYYGDDIYKITKGALKVLLIANKEILDEATQIIRRELGHEVEAVRSKETFLEIIHKDCSKGNALSSMANELGISLDEIMAIGNSQNDMSMLAISGCAVAVANAEENIKAIAQVVTDSNNDDGVAKVIEKLVLQK